MKPSQMPIAGLAYYRKEDWESLCALAVDRSAMHDTWEQWHEAFLTARKNAEAAGMEVKEVVIEPKALQEYCRKHGKPNDGGTRSTYAAELALQNYE